jgi:CRISPR-associated endonuclease/helicase Cas3
MVVCNTVDRAQTLYKSVSEPLKEKKFKVFLLHSRYLDQHRKAIEEEMRKNLEENGARTCLITTQVCEVGLDISCDLLLTELAPADSLIQRMGRCARKGGKGEVWVFNVEHAAPYPECEMIESKRYVSQKLESKRIGWKEELELVNSLLGKTFELIMNDEQRRRTILRSLGDAAFKGSKKDLEKNVRELFNANITIHDNPNSLGFHKLLHMPWIDIDVRVLRRHLVGKAEFWKIDFGHDEDGLPDLRLFRVDDIFPYEYYVVHPDYVKYTSDCGLFFGEKGENFKPIDALSEPKPTLKYEMERWIEHAHNALDAFEKQIKPKEIHSLKLLSKLIGKNLAETECAVALSIALHDLGKLNVDWQKGIHSTGEPLAHTSTYSKVRLPPHATVSAYSMSQLFSCLIGSEIYASAFELAIGHHHHTHAENVPKYKLGWPEVYNGLIKEISEKFQSDIKQNIKERLEIPTTLDASFFDFERRKQYTVYCIVARLIRLSDRASFGIKKNAR